MHRRASPLRSPLAVLGLATILAATGCSGPSESNANAAPPATSAPAATHAPPSTHAPAPPNPTPPPDPIAGMTLAEQVGQLFMVGTSASAAESATLDSITQRHVGNIFLYGRSYGGVAATAAVVARFTALVDANSTAGESLLVATDQEGGEVQVLQGPGFARMPSGLNQGSMAPPALSSAAKSWGAQLKAAGVNMNLGPVVDLVPSLATARHNPPIGFFYREFGTDASTIVAHADAVRGGMAASGVLTVLKHFPGLGYVTANTDTKSGVRDFVVTADGVDAGIYRSEIAAGIPSIMVSSAIYTQIDPNSPAMFSPTVVTGMLRQKLGFTGIVMTDDVSGAQQIASWSPADRAILAISAGVDIVLVSRDPAIAPQMIDAVLAKAQSDPAFALQVSAAARRIVELKALLAPPPQR